MAIFANFTIFKIDFCPTGWLKHSVLTGLSLQLLLCNTLCSLKEFRSKLRLQRGFENWSCLKLGHKNWLTRAAGQTRDQMFPTLWFSISPSCAVAGKLVFFSITFFVGPQRSKKCAYFWKIDQICHFIKIQIPVKLVQIAQIL